MAVVSVIVPIYNVEKYLGRCLDSIINQTLLDIEIICVFDKCNDNSISILNKYVLKDNRIKMYQGENKGLGGARNVGIKNATSEYIGFVDSDDWIEPDTYLITYAAMQETGADMVYYYAQIENEDIAPSSNQELLSAANYHSIKRKGLCMVNDEMVSSDNVVTAWNKLYKRSIINKYNIFFPEKLLGEDVEFFYKYIVMCKSIFYVDEYFYHYVQRTDSMMWKEIRKENKNINHRQLIAYNIYEFYKKYSMLKDYKRTFVKIFLYECFWSDFFRTPDINRPLVLKHASKTLIKMNINLFCDDKSELYKICKKQYSKVQFLGIWRSYSFAFLTVLICKTEANEPQLLVCIFNLCFSINLSFAKPLGLKLRAWKRDRIKYRILDIYNRLNELYGRMEYANQRIDGTNQRMDATDKHVESMNQRIDETNRWVGSIDQRIDETSKWVEGTNKRIDETSKWVEDTNRRIDNNSRQIQGINTRTESTAGEIKRFFTVYNRMITDYAKENKQKILSMRLGTVKNSKNYTPHYQSVASYLKALPYFIFCPNNGNLGDIIIAAAEYQYFKYLGCNYSVFDMYSQTLPESGPIDFVYGGGGIFVKYCNYQNVLEIFKSPHLRRVTVLPSSFFKCPDVLKVFDERFTVFCREKRSYDYCKSLNTRAEFILSDDMAFNLDIADIKNSISPNIKRNIESLNEIYLNKVYESYSFYMSIRIKIIQAFSENTIVLNNRIRAAYLLRADEESKGKTSDAAASLQKCIDLSGFTWTSCADPGVVKLLSALFIDAINTLDVVVTDRLHIGIASAMLGKRVYLLDNIYGKISAVYEHSMQDFENVCFLESLDAFSLENIDATGTNVDLSLFETDKTFAGYFKEYCSVDQMNDVITDSIFTY